MQVGVLLLAAGRSTRFGTDKRIAVLPDGATMLEACIANITQTHLPLLVCLAAPDESRRTLPALTAATHYCDTASQGMGATIAEGVRQIKNWDGVLIALADMPFIQLQTYLTVAGHLEQNNIVTPVHGQTPGHPVGFGRYFFPYLQRLGGDRGARALVNRFADQTITVTVDDAGIHQDIDRPDALTSAPHSH